MLGKTKKIRNPIPRFAQDQRGAAGAQFFQLAFLLAAAFVVASLAINGNPAETVQAWAEWISTGRSGF